MQNIRRGLVFTTLVSHADTGGDLAGSLGNTAGYTSIG